MAQPDEKVTQMFANIERQNLEVVVDKLAKDMENFKIYVGQLMRIRKMAYDAAIVEGFTPEQALTSSMNLGLTSSCANSQPRES